MPDVVLTVSLRPQWRQWMMHALHSDEVTRRMEALAAHALHQFTREQYVTVTATCAGESRTLLRDRWDIAGAPLVAQLQAENIELQHRILMLEDALTRAGVPLPR